MARNCTTWSGCIIPVKGPSSGCWNVYVDLCPSFEVIFLACVTKLQRFVKMEVAVLSSLLYFAVCLGSVTGLWSIYQGGFAIRAFVLQKQRAEMSDEHSLSNAGRATKPDVPFSRGRRLWRWKQRLLRQLQMPLLAFCCGGAQSRGAHSS